MIAFLQKDKKHTIKPNLMWLTNEKEKLFLIIKNKKRGSR